MLRFLLPLLLTVSAHAGVSDLAGKAVDPFSGSPQVRVFLFLRTDCPVSNRYAPELRRIAKEFRTQPVQFWLVYPDRDATSDGIRDQISAYGFPGRALRDPQHELVNRSQASTAPEAAVFDPAGKLTYEGRIDDRWVSFGKSRPAADTHDLQDAISATLAGRALAVTHRKAIGCSLADLR